MSCPRSKRAPVRTNATRWGALTARQRFWADIPLPVDPQVSSIPLDEPTVTRDHKVADGAHGEVRRRTLTARAPPQVTGTGSTRRNSARCCWQLQRVTPSWHERMGNCFVDLLSGPLMSQTLQRSGEPRLLFSLRGHIRRLPRASRPLQMLHCGAQLPVRLGVPLHSLPCLRAQRHQPAVAQPRIQQDHAVLQSAMVLIGRRERRNDRADHARSLAAAR